MTKRQNVPKSPERNISELADALDLRAAISSALRTTPVDHHSLRRAVWTYVGVESNAGKSPGQIILALTGLVTAAKIEPLTAREAIGQRMTLWCVEAYFGHLGGDVVGQGGDARSDSHRAGSTRRAVYTTRD
jgi:hypothetical protein